MSEPARMLCTTALYEKHPRMKPSIWNSLYPPKCLQPHYHTHNRCTYKRFWLWRDFCIFSPLSQLKNSHKHRKIFVYYDWCEKRALWTEWNDESDIIFTPFHSRHVYPVLLQKFFNPERVFHSTQMFWIKNI
jgi:hypothetical protein